MWWNFALSLTIASVAPQPGTCDSVLTLEPAAYVGEGSMVEQDVRSMEWAACLHERSMAKVAGNVELFGQLEEQHEELLAGHRAAGELLWLQCQCNGYMHTQTRDHVDFERDFARLVDVYVAGSAQESNPRTQARVAELRALVLTRLERPSRWDVGQLMVGMDLDSTAALQRWAETARPLTEEARGGNDRGSLSSLEVLAGEVQRLLGDPEKERRMVERELEHARQQKAKGK